MTGTDEKYFFMCGILKESLAKFSPGIPLFVMDFGLSPAQQRILRDLGMLLPRPEGLDSGMHPFRLKSSMDLYVGAARGPWIWIDADIMAVRDASTEVHALCSGLQRDGTRVALAADMGPSRTLRDFDRRYETPNLRSRLQAAPGLGDSPYLNTGLVFFMDDTLLAQWRALALALEPDVLWEQNALNLLVHGGAATRILDPRIWNVQAALIDAIAFDATGMTCGGERTAFVHATSSKDDHLREFSFPVSVDGVRSSGYARLFTNPALLQMQTGLLSLFMRSHPALKAG